jgi:hypothetical protein
MISDLSRVDKEAQGWRIKLRRCVDNLESDVLVEWTDVERLPGFIFDDGNFYGRRPVSTWDWFSLSEVQQYRPQDKLPEHADDETTAYEGLDLDELSVRNGSEELGEVRQGRPQDELPEYADDETMAHGGLALDELLARDGQKSSVNGFLDEKWDVV